MVQDIPIISGTDFTERLSYDGMKTLGVKAVLKKPVKLAERCATVRQVVDGVRG